MQKYPVTVQEMDRIAKTIGLTAGYNDRAMKRTCLLVRLGCEPTAELYQHELSISERHPADVAQEIESRIDAELFLHAAQEPTQPIFTNDPNCTHEKAYAIIGGMMCKCGAKFQPRNEFEQRMVNARSPRSSGYVNWQFR